MIDFTLFKNQDFRHLWWARLGLTLAHQMQVVILGWQIFQITPSPLALGLIGLSEVLPFLTASLWSGHVADRFEKRKLILCATSGIFLVSVFLTTASFQHDIRKMILLISLYALIAINGLFRSFLWASLFSYIEMTIPKELYSKAAAWSSIQWQIGSIAGPIFAGWVYAHTNAATAHSVCVIFLAMALFFLWRCPPLAPLPLSLPLEGGGRLKAGVGVQNEILAGFRFVYSQKTLLGAISLDLVGVLFGGVVALLPIFATQLGVGAIGLGWLHAAPSIGALILAFYYTHHPLHDNMGPFFLGSVFVFGLSIILFAVSQNIYWSAFLLALGGAADNVSVIVRATLMRTLVPDPLRGRVAAVNGIFIGSSNELGAFESGLAAQLLGVIPSVIVGGVITCLSVLGASYLFPELKQMRYKIEPKQF